MLVCVHVQHSVCCMCGVTVKVRIAHLAVVPYVLYLHSIMCCGVFITVHCIQTVHTVVHTIHTTYMLYTLYILYTL